MRRLVVAVAVLAALAAGVVVVGVVTLNRLIDANRERVIAKTTKRIGRTVGVEEVSVGFRRGLAIVLDGIRIGDDPDISPDPLLTADRAYATVRLLPLVRGRVEVRRVVVEAPRATVVRTAKGTSLDTLGRRPRDAKKPQRQRKPRQPAPARAEAWPTMVAFVMLERGELRVVDRRGLEPVETRVAPIDVWLSDPSLDEPIAFRARATVAAAEPMEVTLQGRFGPLGKPPFAQDVALSMLLSVHGGAVRFSNLTVNGTARRDVRMGPTATVNVTAPTVHVGGVELRDLHLDVTEVNGGAIFRTRPIAMFGGEIELQGRVDHRTDPTAFILTPVVRGVDVSRLVGLSDPDAAARIRGRLDVQGTVRGSAGSNVRLRRTLGGDAYVTVHDGALTGVNVADEVLSGLTGFGGLATLVPGRVRERHPQIFAEDDMRFEELRADLRITHGRITVDPIVVTTADYSVRGTGTVGVANRVQGDAVLVASEQLTTEIVGAFSGAKALTDDTGRLAVPFRVTGFLPNVRAKADREYVNRALKEVVVGGIEDLLGGRKDRKRRRR